MDQRQKNERINLILKLLMAILFTTGAIIFSYPFLANAVNSYYDQKMMEKNLVEMAATNTKEQAKRHQEMAEKNKELAESKNMTNIPGMGLVEDPFENEVDDAKDPGKAYYKEHTVGAIYIPKISVSLPLFDETNAALLEKGATILQGTSYPIGGDSTHSVISGHSGLTERKLFTDLEKLVIGDDFYLTIAGEKLAYAVDDIQIVLPSDIDKVVIQPGRDLVTLLTCTPYGINTHRLLVTGHRVPYVEEMAEEVTSTKKAVEWRFRLYLLLIPLFFAMIFYWMYRKFVYYQSGKHSYDFCFYLLENGQPKAGVTFTLVRKKRWATDVTNQPVAVSQVDGWVSFPEIRGGRYYAKAIDGSTKPVKGKVRRLKDRQFVLSRVTKKKHGKKVTYYLENGAKK